MPDESASRRPASAKEIAYAHVKKLVMRSGGEEGFFLSENEIAGALDISRTPVREAFLTLEAEGMLKIMPKRGAYVAPISDREIVELMEARALIETFCARRVVERRVPVTERLEALLREQRDLLSDPEAFIESDRRFHSVIVDAAQHQLFSGVYESLRDRQLRMGVRAVQGEDHRAAQVLAEHARIANAIDAGEPGEIAAAIADHIEQTQRSLRTTWRPQA